MRRVPATELERGDVLVCSDGTRVKIAHVWPGPKRVALRLIPPYTHPESRHPPFSVPVTTHFMRETAA